MTTFTTIVISLIVAIIAYGQFRIASNRTRLDLYDRRFAIYNAVLDAIRSDSDPYEQIWLTYGKLVKAVRESQFLFKPTHRVHEMMQTMQEDVFAINNERRHQVELDGKASSNPDLTLHLFNRAADARLRINENISVLELRLYDYIQFKAVSGWTWWR